MAENPDEPGDADASQSRAAIPYGRGRVAWWNPTGRCFPSGDPLSPVMVAFLVRVDEIRMCHGRMATNANHDPLAGNPSLWSPRLENLMMFRIAIIAAEDLVKHAAALDADARFRAVLDSRPDQRELFRSGVKAIRQTLDEFTIPNRNQLCAHIDHDVLAESLAVHPNGVGSCWLGELQGDFAFEVAHVALMTAMSRTPNDDSFIEGMSAQIVGVSTAQSMAFKIVWPAVWAFDQITGSFFAERVRRAIRNP